MLRLAVQLLLRRIGGAIATLLALTVGVVLLTAMGALLESGLRYQPGPGRYSAADLVVTHRDITVPAKQSDPRTGGTLSLPEGGTVPDALLDRVRRLPGVETAAADHRVTVVAAAPATGHGWSSAALMPYRMVKGEPPTRPDDVVLDTRVAGGAEPGTRARLQVAGTMREFQVTGLADGAGAPSVFFTDVRAAELSGKPGRAAAIGVIAVTGTDLRALAAAVGDLVRPHGADVYTGAERDSAERDPRGIESLLTSLGGTLGGYVMILVVFVVAGTIGLSVRHRRRDLALLRAIAATPGQLRRIVVAEAGVIGLCSAAVGVPVGLLATAWLRDEFVHRGFLPADVPIVVGGFSALVAAAGIVLLAMLSGLVAARRITKIRPVEALSEAAAEPIRNGKIRLLVGVLALAGAGAAAASAGSASAASAADRGFGMLFLSVAAVALLAPWINRVAAWLTAPVLRLFWGASGYLAARNLKANAQATTTVLTALVLSVGFGGSMFFLQDNLARETISQNRAGTLADLALVSPTGLPAAAVADVRRIPGIRAVTGVRHTSVIIAGDMPASVPAQAIDVDGAADTLDLRVISGRLSDLGVDGVAVSRVQAGNAGWKTGQRATFWLGDGTPVTLRVAAIYERGLGFGDITLPRQVVAGHTAKDLDDQILIRTRPGADAATALAELTTRYPGSEVVATTALNRQLAADMALNSWLNEFFIAAMVGYSALAAANAMVMAALSRRQELSVLRLVGVTTNQVKQMVHAEQASLLGVSLVIGGGIAAATLSALVNALTGNPVPYVPLLGWVAVLAGTTLLALGTTVLPIGRLLRIPPVHSIGIKQ